MSKIDQRIAELGHSLPAVAPPLAQYVPAVRVGNLVFLSGHGPMRDGQLVFRGRLGETMSVSEGREAAELVMLNLLASLKAEIGDLDGVRRVVKLLGMVNSAPSFDQQPAVINGASDLLIALFGDRGRHARSAVGVAALPFNIAVEIEMIVEVEP